MYKRTKRPCVKQHFCISNSRCVRLAAHSVSYSYDASTYTERARWTHRPSADVKCGTIARSASTKVPGAWTPAAAAVTLEIRDSQDRRNIAGRKPTKRGPRQCRPVSGSRHDCFTHPVPGKRQRGCVGDLFERAKAEDRLMCFCNVNVELNVPFKNRKSIADFQLNTCVTLRTLFQIVRNFCQAKRSLTDKYK